MSTPLFRAEACEAGASGGLGTPSGLGAVSSWAATALLVGGLVALGALLALGEYTRRARVAGQLVPDRGLVTLVSPGTGVVDRVFGEEGMQVEAGDPLAWVRVPRALEMGTDTHEAWQWQAGQRRLALQHRHVAEQARRDAQRVGQQRQRRAMAAEIAALDAELGMHRQRMQLERAELARHQAGVDAGVVSVQQLDRRRQSMLELASQGQALRRHRATLERQRLGLDQALGEMPTQEAMQQAEHALELARWEQERLDRASVGGVLLQAPVAGRVTYRAIEAGQAVQPGQALLGLLPSGSTLQAELRVPTHAVAFIAPGDRVLLRYAAYPHARFGHHEGHVLGVSRSTLPPAGTPDGPPGQAGYYRVRVALVRQEVRAYGRQEPLRPGMALEADILGERRRLYEWLLEPLYALRGRLAAAAGPAPGAGSTYGAG